MRICRTYVASGTVLLFVILVIFDTFRGSGLIVGGKRQKLVTISPRPNTTISPDIVRIPDDETVDKMTEVQMMELYQHYINTLQALCRNVIRIGSPGDGGKEICVDGAYKPKAPCLIYSFGINNQWDFDKMAVDMFGCEVHCFDPSMKRETGQVSENVWFYKQGLGDRDWSDKKNWEIRTMETIRKSLKHENRTIDILKIDIEGAEWSSILQMLKSGALDDVKQIAIETHFSQTGYGKKTYWGNVRPNISLRALRQLFEAGFRIVMRERNLWGLQKWPPFKYPITNVYEITLIRPS